MGILPGHNPDAGRRGFTLLQALIVLGLFGLLAVLLLPVTRSARPAARRSQCKNNLKQIALALHNYESDYGVLPPAYTADRYGNPLHSWRTLILPYLEQQTLYDQIDLCKAWDDPANAAACNTPLSVFLCPEFPGPQNHTTYLASVGPSACFDPTRSRRRREITDAPWETLLVIEVPAVQSVPWMSPNDADEGTVLKLGADSRLPHEGGMQAAFYDGTVRFLFGTMPAQTRRAMISVAGGDKVGDF